ncbi:uncharacterized protein VTP21DRAFT_11520 [Calcarisporiella thermophila]|uniref:uncharacterized protein n=1 Tax=Calcarisporiella thermophila TaxID=911321 RepID=UPI003742B059
MARSSPIVIDTISSIRAWRAIQSQQGRRVALVPTMGALHEGHLQLVKEAASRCDSVVVSIFVNPAQFAPHEDLDQYPRTLQSDLEALQECEKVEAVFVPKVSEMYPKGIVLEVENQVGAFVEVKGRSHQMEGKSRPTFFRGVATVVSKLFNIVLPDVVIFGQKDAQQCVVIRTLIDDLHFPIEMIVCSTMREQDGLAMSSRNRYLTPHQRTIATSLYSALSAAKELYLQGKRNRDELMAIAHQVFEERIAGEEGVKLDYISLANPRTLEELQTVGKEGAILSGAFWVGKARLIDNLLLDCEL